MPFARRRVKQTGALTLSYFPKNGRGVELKVKELPLPERLMISIEFCIRKTVAQYASSTIDATLHPTAPDQRNHIKNGRPANYWAAAYCFIGLLRLVFMSFHIRLDATCAKPKPIQRSFASLAWMASILKVHSLCEHPQPIRAGHLHVVSP